jgi:Na+/H+ antiporter NhaD/arsenite permease-like protein
MQVAELYFAGCGRCANFVAIEVIAGQYAMVIVLEHPLKLDKTVPALLMAALCWALLSLGHLPVLELHDGQFVEGHIEDALLHHLGKTAEILVFLLGAMTIVEIIDLHRGFEVLKRWVNTKSKRRLLIVISILAFILSAVIDNLTATIVLVTLLRKLIRKHDERIWYAAMVVIAANAGGAWSPIGDVTTTMLWIGKKVSSMGLISHLVIPSIVCAAVPAFVASFMKPFQGQITLEDTDPVDTGTLKSSYTMLFLGLGAIVFVPIFKTITHLPPYVGMMFGLGVVWLVSEYIHPEEDFDEERRHLFSAHKALSRIELSSILFFLGILMAVAALESLGLLLQFAQGLDAAIPNQDIVVMLLGVGSAIIDNVPLVAASMGMYTQEIDSKIWHFIAYAAGTGGSMLIIGSAAGVAAMGMERIDFIWYLRKIAWLAFIGFLAGAGTFLLIFNFTG